MSQEDNCKERRQTTNNMKKEREPGGGRQEDVFFSTSSSSLLLLPCSSSPGSSLFFFNNRCVWCFFDCRKERERDFSSFSPSYFNLQTALLPRKQESLGLKIVKKKYRKKKRGNCLRLLLTQSLICLQLNFVSLYHSPSS